MVQKPKSDKSRSVQDRFDSARAQIDVTQFTAYREFLKHLYDQIKTGRKSYSYVRFATDLGLSASNALWLVLTMRRDLSEASAQKIATALSMSHESRKYFMLLVRHNNARDPSQRESYMKELVVLKSQHFTDSGNDEHTLEFFQEWYHPVLREMVALDEFKP
ncbi:MAG: TIGR02147 family protein, partial [Pseudobdellovibrionaceae bacterium]|nr:TIGR02147 family protein [Pseudobdellovibrionaceae bacterium]